MKGKVINLKPKTDLPSRRERPLASLEIMDYIQPRYDETRQYILQAVARAPEMIRDCLHQLCCGGFRLAPVLFLAIVRPISGKKDKEIRLAASLDALQLAIETHSSMNGFSTDTASTTQAILAGDFYFSLALTAAADSPVFIRGMAEIISRVVSSGVKRAKGEEAINRKAVLHRISDRYGSIIALAATLGSWYSGLELWMNEALAYYGHYIGMKHGLKEDIALFESSLSGFDGLQPYTFPLVCILEQNSALSAVYFSSKAPLDIELLAKEAARLDVESVTNKVIDTCKTKAFTCLKSLHSSLDQELCAVLSHLIKTEALV